MLHMDPGFIDFLYDNEYEKQHNKEIIQNYRYQHANIISIASLIINKFVSYICTFFKINK